jgi:phenylacetate-CoA ligase
MAVTDMRSAWRQLVKQYMYHPDAPGADRYWVPETETASRARLQEIQNDKLSMAVRFLYEHSRYYRRLFDERKLAPDDVRTTDDLWKVPVLTKDALGDDQVQHPPWGTAAPLTEEVWSREGWLLFATSGTTALPRAFRVTRHDREVLTWMYCRALYAGGIRPGHVALNCFSYGPFSAFWGAHLALNVMGCSVIPGGGMDTRRRASFIAHYRPSILICTPSYALYLGETLRELGHDPARSAVRFLITAGEPGPCIPATKARIEGLWGAQIVDNYGSTEVAPAPLAYTCWEEAQQRDRPMNMHLTEDMYVPEVLDPDTWEPVAPGQRGVMVCTNLWSEGQPFLRYAIGDYLTVADHGCACGRTHVQAVGGFVGRPDDMVKVRGVVLFPSTIESIVRRVPDLTNEFMLLLTSGAGGLDELIVRVEAAAGVAPDRYPTLDEAVREAIRTHVGIRAGVEVLAPGTLPRTEFKARRIEDRRLKAY